MTTASFWKLDHCSDEQLLARIESIVRSCRQRTAELVAHLGEVEARRLHLDMAHGSLFDYCVRRLGLSEDEACRRIDVARLARRFPALFPRLASGEISLTVAAVLKPYLSEANATDVVASVSGKTVRQAREALAALFPQPDVASSVRKLPEQRVVPLANVEVSSRVAPEPEAATRALAATAHVEAAPTTPRLELSAPMRKVLPAIEPLSQARYRVQFTASMDLKRKLEWAQDLMRHRNPSGDLVVIVERAVELLLNQLMKERFGTTKNPRSQQHGTTSRISNATRRLVVERDGLRCSWVDAEGRRCDSRAWLEFDHRHPRGKGGASDSENIRLLCRAHNQLAAEHEYGRGTIKTAIGKRQEAAAGRQELDAGTAGPLNM